MQETVKIINKYFDTFPEDREDLLVLDKQSKGDIDFFDRKNFTGHVVANALILSGDDVLTIFHNNLRMYIQPGGHVDESDTSVIEATIREVEEETGIKNPTLDLWHKKTGLPIYIESHLVPENTNKKEDKHYHHDFMYIFRVESKDVSLQLEEVSDFSWVRIDDVLKNNPESFIGKSLKRMIHLGILSQ